MKESTIEVTEKDPNSKDKMKNESNIHEKDAETEVGDENIKVTKIFEYLIPTDEDPSPFSFDLTKSTNLNIYEEAGEYKYTICILLKNNSYNNCRLLQKTIEGIYLNLESLKTLEIEMKDIYIFIFINQIVNYEYLIKKESIKTLTKVQFLRFPVKIKSEDEEENKLKIDIICKKYEMTPIESLKCFYNYCVFNLKKEDKFLISSIITAGIYPKENSLKKLIQISCLSYTKNQNKSSKNLDIAIPSLEVNENKDFFIKIAQYDRAHFNLYNMSFYSSTAAVPISSLLNTMIIDKSLMDDLKSYYRTVNINSSIDYHDYNLSLYLYRNLYQINYYYDEPLGLIQYNDFTYMEYKDNWVDKFSGYYGNFFSILMTFTFCNNILKNIFMFFQIIGIIIEFIYPALSIMVIYSIFYEAFNIYDKSPAIFMTLLYLIIYLGSGVCSVISHKSEKIELTNYFFYIFMEVYYLFILVCSIPAMDNIKKKKTNGLNEEDSLYTFNSAGCAFLIIFTLIIAILPIVFKISVISKNIVQMIFYFVLGAPSSTSTFLIAKIWRAPETSGGDHKEERKGIMIITFFLFNLFIGFLSFYNFNREKRANAVMGLAIFYLIYLFFKIIAIIFPLLSGIKLEANAEEKIKNIISSSEKSIFASKNILGQSNVKLKKNDNDNDNDNDNENDNDNDNENNNENNNENEEKLDKSNNENNNNEEEEKNEENNNSQHNESKKNDDDEVENN